MGVKVVFNCPCTPAFNLIETVFCDLKCYLRRKNLNTAQGLIDESRIFLNNNVNEEFI